MTTLTIFLIVATVLLIVAIIATIILIRKARKASAEKGIEKTASISPAYSKRFARAERRDLASSFRSVLASLRERNDSDDRYLQPWYVLIGPSGAGKSALFADSDLATEIAERIQVEQDTGLAWNIFDEGVVMDVSGDWSFENSAASTTRWQQLLRLIVRHRPARALDGIIVALPADQFLSNALDVAMLEQAAVLQQRLRTIQMETSIRLPIYLVITQSEAIDGFGAFASVLCPEERQSMLGWINPYSSEVQFQPDWTDQALGAVRHAVEDRLNRIFATEEHTRAHDSLFLLPANIGSIAPSLRAFLTRALRAPSDIGAPMLRGIFFSSADEPSALPAVPQSAFHHPRANFQWDPLGYAQPGMAPRQQFLPPEGRIHFVYDLFLRRIFKERVLATPLPQFSHARRQVRRTLQTTAAILAVTLLIGTLLGYLRINRAVTRLQPLMANIANDMSDRSPSFDRTSIHTPTDDLIRAMLELRRDGVHAFFYPWSWGHPVDAEIQRAMVPALRVLVLERFEAQLEQRAAQITDVQQRYLVDTTADTQATIIPGVAIRRSIETLPAYKQQRAFVDDITALQLHIDQYIQLSTPGNPGSLQTVAELDSFLNHRPVLILPEGATSPVFDEALAQTTWRAFHYSARDQRNAATRHEAMSVDLFQAAIEHNRIREAADALILALNRMSGAKPSYEQIRMAQQAFSALNAALADPDLVWVGRPDFAIPPRIAQVTTSPLGRTAYLPDSLRPTLELLAQESYQRLMNSLMAARTSITGAIFEVKDGRLALSQKAQETQLGLDNLLTISSGGVPSQNPLTGGQGSSTALSAAINTAAVPQGLGGPPATIQAYGGNITWNKAALDAAAAQPANLKQYLEQGLGNAPAALQASLGDVARERAGVTIETAIAAAESPGPRLPPEPQIDADLKPAVARFTAVSPTLRNLLDSLQALRITGAFSRLRAATDLQALTLLGAIDHAFNREAPYQPRTSAFDRWNGTADPAVVIFAADTKDDLPETLAAQRERLRLYASLAAPLVDFLNAANTTTSTSTVLRRWRGITAALKQYDAKAPTNSVSVLESYISTEFGKARVSNGCLPGAATFPRGTSDYFTQVYFELRDSLHARCIALLGAQQTSAYDLVATRFNRELAHRYPFTGFDSNQSAEADSGDAVRLYQLYAQNAGLLAAVTSKDEKAFLRDLGTGQPLFSALGGIPANSVDFTAKFRTAREHEIGGEQIVDWTMQVGPDTIRSSDPERKLTWTVGQPITLTLRWAANAPYVPTAARTAYSRANSAGVTYTFTGNWALLRLLQTFSAPATAWHTQTHDGLLLFRIPETGAATSKLQTRAIGEARVYLRVTLFVPGKQDAVAAPQFPLPSEAPVSDTAPRTPNRTRAPKGA